MTLDYTPENELITIVLGNFDGVHLGHLKLIQEACISAKNEGGKTIAYTFSNHPSWVLKNKQRVSLIIPLKSKLDLLKASGIDEIYLKQFTEEFAKQTSFEFFQELKNTFHLNRLVLGHDACLGQEREYNKGALEAYAKDLGFCIQWTDPLFIENTPISSTAIRKLIQKGDFEKIPQFLGRPFSWDLSKIQGQGLGSALGYPTLNFSVDNLTLPPLGVYLLTLEGPNSQLSYGLGNLGRAPTLKKEPYPLLEVFLFNPFESPYYRISFKRYLREEKLFANKEALQRRISKDISDAKSWISKGI